MRNVLMLVFFFCCAACGNLEKHSRNLISDTRKADVYAFKFENDSLITGVLIDSRAEENTRWYGFAFTNFAGHDTPSIAAIKQGKIFGRKVQSMIDPKGYEVGLDLVYINDTLFNSGNLQKIGTLDMDFKRFNIAAFGYAQTYHEVEMSFDYGRMRRKDPPDHYTEVIEKLDKFRPDQYFEIADFLH